MEQLEDIRRKALELFERKKYNLRKHTMGRMSQRGIYLNDIKLVLLHGSFYNKEVDSFGDIRYAMRGWDHNREDIRVVFVIKENLIIITVIREEENV